MKRSLIYSSAMLLGLSGSMPCWAQTTLSPAARILDDARILSNASTLTRSQAAAQDSILSAYLTFDASTLDRTRLEALGVTFCLTLGETATVRLPLSALREVAQEPGVVYLQTATPVEPMLYQGKTDIGADRAHTGIALTPGAPLTPFDGTGVVVGIIDAGFDFTHPAFYDASRQQSRIRKVWLQADEPFGDYTSPQKFGYGIELHDAQEVLKAKGDVTTNSHGTHVAGIAAGADTVQGGQLQGVAPGADIVMVSYGASSRDNVNLTNAIAYIFDYATAVGKPCVINMSLGNHLGPHDGTSTFDVMLDGQVGPGRLIVGSAGNFGNDKFHLSRQFTATDSTWSTFIDYKYTLTTRTKGGVIDLWADASLPFDVYVSAYSLFNQCVKDSGFVYRAEPAYSDTTLRYTNRYFSGDVVVASEVSPLNGKRHIMLQSEVTKVNTNYAIALSIVPHGEGQMDLWADDSYLGFTDKDLAGFAQPTTESTIAEIGGTAHRIISAGAYTTQPDYGIMQGGTWTPMSTGETLSERCSFSSFGPTADGRTKPDICAPGCVILSAVSNYDASGTKAIGLTERWGDAEYSYGYMMGTSMAAPFVTGTLALWLQAQADLSPESARSLLQSTARKDAATGETPAPCLWGAGKVDAYQGLLACIEAAGIESTPADFDLGNLKGASIMLLDLQGRCVAQQEWSNEGDLLSIGKNLSSGIYLCVVKCGNRCWKKIVAM